MQLRALRRDRAFRRGPELYLHERAFEDCLERLAFVTRTFDSALLIGCPDPAWPDRLRAHAQRVDAMDPGPLFAAAAGGTTIVEDAWSPLPASYDLCVAVGTLDTVNDLARALRAIGSTLRSDSLFIGSMVGGDSLPRLRAAMFAADKLSGSAAPHVHPRIDGATLAALLSSAGFAMPVVDVDRVSLTFQSLSALVSDLRAMGATNLLHARRRTALSRAAVEAANRAFLEGIADGRAVEQVEILNFAAWSPPAIQG